MVCVLVDDSSTIHISTPGRESRGRDDSVRMNLLNNDHRDSLE